MHSQIMKVVEPATNANLGMLFLGSFRNGSASITDSLLYKSVHVLAKPGQKAFNRMFFESIHEGHEHVIFRLLPFVDSPLELFDGRDLAIQELIGTGQA